jgi:sarcosine oxidase/L-pipecolate oxidase
MVVPVSKNERVLIVGAGCFGLSTAYHLLRRGFADVTVIDRSEKLPAPDAASNDMNRSERVYFPFSETISDNLPLGMLPKVVRTSYSDIFYSQLACDAIQEWRKTDEWGDTYRE